MIFLTNVLKYTKWLQLLWLQNNINIFILNKKKYTPFKKSLINTKYSFTFNNFILRLDNYNKSYIGSFNYFIDHKLLWENYQLIFIPLWRRVVFKGKGFRMRKFKYSRKLTFNFGRSHWTKLRLQIYFIQFIRKRRQCQYFFCFSFLVFDHLQKLIKTIRVINRYTKRGLRLKKQAIKRRFGKISQMISAHNY